MKNLLKLLVLVALCLAASQRVFAQNKNNHPVKLRKSEAQNWEEASTARVNTYVLRLKPGQDLRLELEKFTKAKKIQAGYIITCAGSLTKASLRLADKSDSTSFDGKFEIVSLVGTLTPDGPHLHIAISDGTGKTIGGHLVAGCEIYTTAEIIIGDAVGLGMTREPDATSGYNELKVRKASHRKRR